MNIVRRPLRHLLGRPDRSDHPFLATGMVVTLAPWGYNSASADTDIVYGGASCDNRAAEARPPTSDLARAAVFTSEPGPRPC